MVMIIFITAFISFFAGAVCMVLFLWWFLGYLNRKGDEDG